MSNPFDASASMLGYLYQIRLALLESLRRLRSSATFTTAIEALDDISFQREGSSAELLQTKHHVDREGDLGDSSSDIWKSLRVWAESEGAGRASSDAIYYLVTTSVAQPGSAASMLRTHSRNVAVAKTRLDATAESSANQGNLKAYQAYLRLSDPHRYSLLDRVFVLDRTPDIVEIQASLEAELMFATVREFVQPFLKRLEGWWFQRVIRQLRDRNALIVSEEFDAEMDRLRQQFRQDNLPIDDDLLSIDMIDEDAFGSHMFVAQLRLIDLASKRVLTAMRQYFRASEQRSRWLREGILHFGELERYDQQLCEEWDTRFQIMTQELGQDAAEDAMKLAARELYKWAELENNMYIRPACTQSFVSRGSLQILSDKSSIGWHPEFRKRLTQLLQEDNEQNDPVA